MTDMISFPHLGIVLEHVGRTIRIGSFEIAYYGMIIAAAMMAGIYLAMFLAKRTGQDPDLYFNFAIIAIILSVIGARVYYVVFSWDYYGAHPWEILNFRGGGLAIYGGVITAILTGICYSKWHHMPALKVLDTAIPCLILGQAIGRWGNFFNREAFGAYTDSLFAMRLPMDAVASSDITQEMLDHVMTENGTQLIQVHPTFLYESLWNLAVFAVLMIVLLKCKNRYDGKVLLLYLFGYGLGRVWIEGLRTDQLTIGSTGIAISQVLSGVLVLCAGAALVMLKFKRSDV